MVPPLSMATPSPAANSTARIISLRERVGVGVLAFVSAWIVYMVGLLPWLFEVFTSVESEVVKLGIAMATVASVVLVGANAQAVWALAWPPIRRLINKVTPVLPIDVTAERIKQISSKLVAVDKKCHDVAMLRMQSESAVTQLQAEVDATLREAGNPKSSVDEATLGRRLNRAQETLRLRQEQLEVVRADEDALLDAREVCDLCVQRLQASLERYKSTVEIARTVTGVRALVGGAPEGDSDSMQKAEAACMNELAEVDALMTNLDTALYDRKLGDRVAALQVAELRQASKGSTSVRVDVQDVSEAATADEEGSEVSAERKGDRRRGRGR